MKKIRMITAGTILSAVLIAAGAGTAAADKPIDASFTLVLPAENPCTEQPMTVTIDVTARVHNHERNVLAHYERTGTTSDGYTLDRGVAASQANDNVMRANTNDIWRNETGSAFAVHELVFERGDDSRYSIEFTCLRP